MKASESIDEAIMDEPMVPTPPEPILIPTSVINKTSKRKETSPKSAENWMEASGRKAAKQRKPSSPSPSPKSLSPRSANRFEILSSQDDVLEDGEVLEVLMSMSTITVCYTSYG